MKLLNRLFICLLTIQFYSVCVNAIQAQNAPAGSGAHDGNSETNVTPEPDVATPEPVAVTEFPIHPATPVPRQNQNANNPAVGYAYLIDTTLNVDEHFLKETRLVFRSLFQVMTVGFFNVFELQAFSCLFNDNLNVSNCGSVYSYDYTSPGDLLRSDSNASRTANVFEKSIESTERKGSRDVVSILDQLRRLRFDRLEGNIHKRIYFISTVCKPLTVREKERIERAVLRLGKNVIIAPVIPVKCFKFDVADALNPDKNLHIKYITSSIKLREQLINVFYSAI